MPKAAAARRLPKAAKSPADTRRILAALSQQHPGADTELRFSNAYELLVATILSAQCTDERVNQVTPALFTRYPDARALARASTAELEPQIQSTGFFRAKSRSLVGMAADVVERYNGEIPRTMEGLVSLPGVGRKTANVVLGHALGVPGLPVDRHVLRVSNRIGIARSDDPEIVEQQLNGALPLSEWTRASDTLILHGRRVCKPKPLCDRCAVCGDCNYYRSVVRPDMRAAARTKQVTKRSEHGKSVAERRAVQPRGTRGDGAALARRSEHGKSVAERRAVQPRGRDRDGAALARRSEHGKSVEKRRAAKPRGTGGGGGAPPHVKK